MKSIEAFILKIIKKIEGLQEGLIAYAYKPSMAFKDKNFVHWEIAVSDFDFYFYNKHFKMLRNAWCKAARKSGNLLFFVYCNPLENKLAKLAREENLIMDV